MKKINIYVGRTNTKLVLKYSSEPGEKEFCRYYSLEEDPNDTAYFLKLEMKKNPAVFKPLIDKDKNHGIKPANKSQLEQLASAFQKVKI